MKVFRQGWSRLARNEQRLVLWTSVLLLLVLVWFVAVAPALRTLSTVTQRLAALDTQLQAVERMAAQAKSLQSRPPLARADALRGLEGAATLRFGSAASVQGSADRVTITLKGVAPDALAQWLGQVRQNSGAVVEQASLRQLGSLWEGTLAVSLPAGP